MHFSPKNLKTKIIQKRFKKFFLLSFFLASSTLPSFLVRSTALAATGINEQISFQGKVVNADGTNVTNGSFNFLFCLYTTASPATPCTAGADNDAVWRESKSLTVTDGIFQSNLGDTTTLPGSVDFNTDNIYLGINFNSDGEMSPLVRFTAAPYALNAAKVGGLTVTDTTGTLTIPNGKTISFADAFTTTGAFPLTLTSTASTTATLPSGTITLADLATSQTLTNKIIGSTGLTFTGATTDITTGTGEDLTVVANGAGIISLNDAVTVSNTMTLSSITGSTQCLHVDTSGIVSGTGADCGVGSGLTIGDTVTSGTAGSLLFVGSGPVLSQDNANLFWDDTNNRLGLGDVTPDGVLDFDFASSSSTAASEYGANFTVTDTGVVTTGTDTTYGSSTSVTRTGATGGTINSYGQYTLLTTDNAGAGTSTAYGSYIDTGVSGATNADTVYGQYITTEANAGTAYGLYVDAGAGAGTEYAGIFLNGNVGIGDSSPSALLTVGSGDLFQVNSSGTVSIATGQSYTGAGTVTLSSATTNALTVDSGTTGTVNLGTGNNAKTVAIATGTAGNIVNIGTDNTTSDTIAIGSVLDNVAITGDQWSVTDAGALTVVSCSGCGGGGGDLQTSYATDADGSDATISLTTGDDSLIFTNPTSSGTDSAFLLHLNQQHTTGAVSVLDITQASSGANAVNLTANTIDTEIGLNINTNALTSGKAIAISSSSTAFTGNLQNITLSGSNAANTGTLLAIDNTGTSNANTSLYIKHYATGTNNLAFRVDDVSGDTTPFVIDGTGAVGIGTTAPTTLFELYGTGSANAIATLTAPDATYDPIMKFRTGASPAVQFTLGVDNTDSDKFKIYSGDGLGGGDEFVIDSNGVTTIANLNLGATNFDTDAGAVSWVDMPVTASAPITTVESYSAMVDGTSFLTIYAESDGSGSIQDKRIQIGTSGAGTTTPTLLALDVKSDTGDPTGFEGAIYYNTFDNVFRCYQSAAWTNCIGSGGSSDLQTAYGNDADGGNVTISLTAADDGLVFTNPTSGGNNLSTFLLQLDQANTTANALTLDIIQASNASNAVNLTANAIDGETGLAITTNGLTSGSALTVASSSVAFTGSLAGVTLSGSNAANTGNAFAVSNTGALNTGTSLFVQHNATGTNNLAVRVNDEAADATPFVIDGTGSVGIGTTAPARLLDIVQAASAPQLRLSKDLTNYSEMTVDSAGDLLIGATGTDIRALSENVWVCDNDACPALTLTGDGNIFVENVIKFGNGVYMKNDSATELGVYDNDDQAMLIFDEL
ncbi:MAG: hypothetical protein KBD27_01825 [Candidatus Moranbacteria bacterium]|nr:hypothetical protein [Candidatus Moranbacteria bacterium]